MSGRIITFRSRICAAARRASFLNRTEATGLSEVFLEDDQLSENTEREVGSKNIKTRDSAFNFDSSFTVEKLMSSNNIHFHHGGVRKN